MQSFFFLDLLFLLVIFLLFFRGFLKGSLKELFSFGMILFAFYLVNFWNNYFIFLKSFLTGYGFGSIFFKWSLFIFIWFAGTLILFVVFKFINLKAKGFLSRFLGGMICMLKGCVLIFVVSRSLDYSLFDKFIKNSNSLIMPILANLNIVPFLTNLNRQVIEIIFTK